MSDVVAGSAERSVEIAFPENGANSDGYTAVTVSFGRLHPTFPPAAPIGR